VLFVPSDRHYHIDRTIIYLVYAPKQADVAEAFTENAGGSTQSSTGEAGASVKNVSVFVWEDAKNFTLTEPTLPIYHQMMIERWKRSTWEKWVNGRTLKMVETGWVSHR
jgi:hypothetical protein